MVQKYELSTFFLGPQGPLIEPLIFTCPPVPSAAIFPSPFSFKFFSFFSSVFIFLFLLLILPLCLPNISLLQIFSFFSHFRSARTFCTTFDWCARARPPVRVQEFLLFLLLLLLSRHPCHPGDPSPSPQLLLLSLLIIRRDRPLATNYPEGPASYK